MLGKFTFTQVITTVGSVLALITAVFTIDARYTKDSDLTAVKNEIIQELRSEVTKNRSVMIDTMQREADDVEFQIEQLKAAGTEVPRFLVDKFKTITRSIEKLQQNEKTPTD